MRGNPYRLAVDLAGLVVVFLIAFTAGYVVGGAAGWLVGAR